jgi:hypothetical protein
MGVLTDLVTRVAGQPEASVESHASIDRDDDSEARTLNSVTIR